MQFIQGESLAKVIEDLRRSRDAEHQAKDLTTSPRRESPRHHLPAIPRRGLCRTMTATPDAPAQPGLRVGVQYAGIEPVVRQRSSDGGEPTLTDDIASISEGDSGPPARPTADTPAGARLLRQLRANWAARRTGTYYRAASPGSGCRRPGARLCPRRDRPPRHQAGQPPARPRDRLGRRLRPGQGRRRGPHRAATSLGTLRYMAPERFDGGRRTRRRLLAGLTLYELLTLRPAFDDEDRRRLLHKVLYETRHPEVDRYPDPARPRNDVLKAIDREPAARFKDAKAMGDEFQRFVDGRTLTIRQVSWPRRFVLWCKREPWLAGANIAAAVLTTAVAVVATLYAWTLSDRNRAIRAEQGKTQTALTEKSWAELDARRQTFGAWRPRPERGRSPAARVSNSRPCEPSTASLLPAPRPGLEARERRAAPGRPRSRDRRPLPPRPGVRPDVPAQDPARFPLALDPILRTRLRGEAILPTIPKPAFILQGWTRSHVQPRRPVPGRGIAAHRPQRGRAGPGLAGGRPEATTSAGGPGRPQQLGPRLRPDGRHVAFGHQDGSVSVYDTRSGKEVRRLPRVRDGASPGVPFAAARDRRFLRR